MVYKVREANQPIEPAIASLTCMRSPERASFDLSPRNMSPFQLEALASTARGIKKNLSNEDIVDELKKLVSSCSIESIQALCQILRCDAMSVISCLFIISCYTEWGGLSVVRF